MAANFYEGPFQSPDVFNDVLGNEVDHVVLHIEIVLLSLFAKNGHSGFEIRSLNIGDQSPLESGYEAIL